MAAVLHSQGGCMAIQHDLELVRHERAVQRVFQIRPQEQANVHAGMKSFGGRHMIDQQIGVTRPEAVGQRQAAAHNRPIFEIMIDQTVITASLNDKAERIWFPIY